MQCRFEIYRKTQLSTGLSRFGKLGLAGISLKDAPIGVFSSLEILISFQSKCNSPVSSQVQAPS